MLVADWLAETPLIKYINFIEIAVYKLLQLVVYFLYVKLTLSKQV